MKKILLSATALVSFTCPGFAAQAPAAPVEEVIITASPLISDPIDQSQSVAQIPNTELLRSGGFGLGDALRDVPGVTSSSFSPGAVRPVIRGFDATRVRVTENGIGSHDVSDISGDHGVPIDPLSATRIEVLRGPGTLRYGSQAIGGVVNAINNRIPLDVSEGTGVELFTGGASNGWERMGGGLVDYRGGNLALHVDGLLRGADDYETPQGTQPNTYAFGRGVALGGAYVDGMSGAGASYNHFFSHYGIANEPGGEVSHIDLTQNTYAGAGRLDAPLPGIQTITARGGYSDYSHDEIVGGEGVLATFNNKEWEGRLEAMHAPFGPFATGAAGVQWDHRDFEALGEGADYLLPAKTRSLGFYVFERFNLGNAFSLEAAGRVERNSTRGSTNALGGFDRDFTPTSIALGALIKPMASFSLGLNLSQTERAPSPSELFAQGRHEASHTFEFGDPTLGKERARSAEFVAHYDGEDGRHATFSAFRTQFDGFIAGLLSGNSYDADGNFLPGDSGEFKELFYRQRDATFWGFEAQAHLPLWSVADGNVGVDAQADYVRAEFDAGGNVPRIPPLRYGGGLFFERNGLELRAGLLHTTSQNEVALNEEPTDGYTMVNASAVFRVYDGDAGAMNVSLSGSNLTDERAHNHVSLTKEFVELPGRSFRLMLHFVR
jgi:iron complex outermembrane recepter protein